MNIREIDPIRKVDSDQSLTFFSKQENDYLKTLALERIAELKKCKNTLITKSKMLISSIEELLASSLQRMNRHLSFLSSLLSKQGYTIEEISKINKIKKIKLVAIPVNQFTDIGGIFQYFNQRPYRYKPIYNDDFEVKLKDFKNHNYGKIEIILKSPDNSFYVTGGTDGVIRIWDTNGNIKNSFYYEQQGITALALSADKEYLVSGSYDLSVKIIKLKYPDKIIGEFSHLKEHRSTYVNYDFPDKKGVISVLISAKNQFVISKANYEIIVLDLRNMIYKKFNCLDVKVTSIRHSGNQEYIIVNDFRNISIINCNLQSLPKNFKQIANSNLSILGFSKSGKYAISSISSRNYDSCIKVIKLKFPYIWDFENKEKETIGVKIKKLYGYKKLRIEEDKLVQEIFVSENFKYFAFRNCKNIYIWSTKQNRVFNSLKLKKYQKVTGLSHGILFIDIGGCRVLGWNITKKKTWIITVNYFKEYLPPFLSKDKKLAVFSGSNGIECIDVESSISYFKYNNSVSCALIKKNNIIISLVNDIVKKFEKNKEIFSFKIRNIGGSTFSLGFLSGDETHVLFMSAIFNISLLINIEEHFVVGIFTKSNGLNKLYSKSSKNSEFIKFSMLARQSETEIYEKQIEEELMARRTHND